MLKGELAVEVRNVSLSVAMGEGICAAAKEDKEGWGVFLKYLKERGLRDVPSSRTFCLSESAAKFFLDAVWEGCAVHWHRERLEGRHRRMIRSLPLISPRPRARLEARRTAGVRT